MNNHTKNQENEHLSRTLQDLNMVDDFLFSRVMADKEVCRMLLEKLLNVKIRKLMQLEEQKTVNLYHRSRGVRFDVYVKDDENTVFEVEMQNSRNGFLPKRMRYYQGNLDFDFLAKGQHYENLPKSFIIFICSFDPYQRGRHLYTFRTSCVEEPDLLMGEETENIVLNTRGTANDVDGEMLELLHYLEESTDRIAECSKSPLIKKLHSQVQAVKENRTLGVEFMTLEEKLKLERKEGWESGRLDGLLEGERCGIIKGRLETAAKLKIQGIALDIIAEATGLELEELENL